MAHTDAKIAALERELVELKADRDAENAAFAGARPAGIPATWRPITFKRGEADWLVIGWIDPDFKFSVYRDPQVTIPTPPVVPGPPS